MSDDLKNYPASDLKLEQLRNEGVVPFSRDLITFAVMLGFFVGMWFLFKEQGSQVVDFFEKSFSSLEPRSLLGAEAMDLFFFLCFAVLLAILILVVITGGYQTRFLINFSLLNVDFSRLFNFEALVFSGARRRLLISLASLVKVCLWIAVWGLFVVFVFLSQEPSISLSKALLDQNTVSGGLEKAAFSVEVSVIDEALRSFLESYGRLFLKLWLCALGLCFVLGVLSRFTAVLDFHREHRMTRAEVEVEYREMESAPEMRTARKELSQDEQPEEESSEV